MYCFGNKKIPLKDKRKERFWRKSCILENGEFYIVPKTLKSCSRITVQLLNHMIHVFHGNLFKRIQKLVNAMPGTMIHLVPKSGK